MNSAVAEMARGTREHVLAIQRARILDATVFVVREREFAHITVASVCARAKVSRSTFFDLFDGREDCFLAVLDDGYQRVQALIFEAFVREQSWLDGVRGALAALLSFFDCQPVLAYVLIVESSAAGTWARERRERHLQALTSFIEAHWGAPRAGHPHRLVPAGVMASLLGTLHTHLVTRREEPTITLLGALMGLVTAPYLDQLGVAREIERADAVAQELLAGRRSEQMGTFGDRVKIPSLLRDPRARRARACLMYLVEHPGASNRDVARSVGIARDAQISTLLARLQAGGLAVKHPGSPGRPNSWSPSPYGLRVADALRHARLNEGDGRGAVGEET